VRRRGRGTGGHQGHESAATARGLAFVRGLTPDISGHDRHTINDRAQAAADAVPMLIWVELLSGAALHLSIPISAWHGMAFWTLVAPLLVMLMTSGGYVTLSRRRGQPSHFNLTVYAVVQALCWSCWLAAMSIDGSISWPMATLACGVVALAATLAFVPVPLAATLFLSTVAAALTLKFAMASDWLAALAVPPLLGMVVVAIGSMAERSYAADYAWRSDANGALKAAALLEEFEQQRRGWFWETDSRGNLAYISTQLAAEIDSDAGRLIGTPMVDLILQDPEGGEAWTQGERTLGFHLAARLAFSEIAVRGVGMKDPCWWSLSGRPVFDEHGSFRGFRGSGTDLTEMRRSEAEVKRLASYDVLTGLPNRMLMRRTLDETLRDVAGRPAGTALFLLDLDRFKMVNDTLGHPIGDVLLRQVAERLTRVIQADGQVGRLGGDEFNVVLPGMTDRHRLAKLAEAVIHDLSRPYMIEGAHVTIGASIGIALAPDHSANADALIRNADLALYAAKADGKGVHRFYNAEMHTSAKDRRLLEMDLRKVMIDHGLHLAYQPVVDTSSEAIVGFEALARWDHPTRGMVSPADFIPVAEEIGLISQIGEWVLRTACMEAANWPASVRIAVNISPIQFANPALPGIVMGALAAAQLPADRLELEITEGVFLNDDANTDAMFTRLKGIGVRLVLDDFGTGYSSLGYLKKAPFDKIKIDQSFVRGAALPGSRNGAIVRAIVTLAESLEMETTAEGAETPAEIALIRSLGCSHIQGYIFGKPMLADEARARVAGTGKLTTPEALSSREPRVAVLRSVIIRGNGPAISGRVRNLSRSGAMIECGTPQLAGKAITLEFTDGRQVSGKISWAESDKFGLAFDELIEIDQRAAAPPMRRAG
jgi:diguanylate cyclase (GGDEF)-like protein